MDFYFERSGDFTELMQEAGVVSFNDACRFVSTIPYQRISNKDDLSLVYHERRGTCSSKHAFLKVLAEEQGMDDLQLVLIFFKMSENTHSVLKGLFDLIDLDYIPEAHICLKKGEEYLDFTTRFKWDVSEFVMEEQIIDIETLLNSKKTMHKNFISNWNKSKYSLEEIWSWREQCIKLLSKQ